MFLGISSAGGSCSDYAGACRVLERASKTPTGKTRQPKTHGFPLGGHSKSVTWVRELDDNAIAVRLYETDVVVWHADNSVEVDNFGTVTTSQFAHRFLPEGIHLRHPTRNGGANTISFGGWRDGHICQGVPLFREVGGAWRPDEDTLDSITLPTGVDRTGTRYAARRYNLRDFETWLSMAPMHLAGTENQVEHDEWSLSECMDALEKRDFRRAAEHLPLIEDKGAFNNELKPLPILTPYWARKVTMSSFARLKLALWEDEGLLTTETRKVWDRKAYDRGVKRLKQMSALNLSTYGMGPR